jgi:polysaccharide biosynthesis transport protein
MQHVRPSNDPALRLKSLSDQPIRTSPKDIIVSVLRYWKGLCAWIFICVGIAAFYLHITPPEYYASSNVILEPRTSFANSQGVDPGLIQTNLDNSQVESQIQIVKSEQVLRYVFDVLKLKDEPEFVGKTTGPPATGQDAARQDAAAFSAFSNRVSVRRIGQSLVLEIGFQSRSATRAASIANSVTAAYIRDQIEAKALSMQRNSEWLQVRINEIKTQAAASEEGVRTGVLPNIQFLASDARIITSAIEPLRKSYPQTTLILILAFALALLTGLGAISIRHSLDRRIRNKRHIYREFGLPCISVVPWAKEGKGRAGFRDFLALSASEGGSVTPFAESLRAARTSIMGTKSISVPHLVGIVSCLPNEGKSTIASNLAHLFAASGRHTLLIDGDLRHFELTRNFAPDAQSSLDNILNSKNSRQATVSRVPIVSELDFIPSVNAGQPADVNQFVDSSAMQTLFGKLKSYEYVIMDLPAMSVSSDVKAIAPLLNSIVLVIEAGRTTIDDISEGLEILQQVNVKVLGTILNKVPERDLPALLPKQYSASAWRGRRLFRRFS